MEQMCLILIAHQAHPRYRLIVAANRDEFYDRPSATARFWPESPDLLGGLDLKKMGTWLGLTRTGRWAAVTNFRDPAAGREKPRSRGELVRNYLYGQVPPAEYLDRVRNINGQFEGFNLLVGDLSSLWYYSNRQKSFVYLAPGVYGLSNHLVDTPWPKVVKGKAALRRCLEDQEEVRWRDLFKILSDRSRPGDDELPDTGVGLERERVLSSIFIDSLGYGTRTSTVLLVDRMNNATFVERSFPESANKWAEVKFVFTITVDKAESSQV